MCVCVLCALDLCHFFAPAFGRCGKTGNEHILWKKGAHVFIRFYFRCLLYLALNDVFGFLYASPCCGAMSLLIRHRRRCHRLCATHSHIKYKLVRKYYDNVAAVASAFASAAALLFGCCHSSGAFYGLVNIIFISIFVFILFFSHLVRVCYFSIVAFLPITHFIYSYYRQPSCWWCLHLLLKPYVDAMRDTHVHCTHTAAHTHTHTTIASCVCSINICTHSQIVSN